VLPLRRSLSAERLAPTLSSDPQPTQQEQIVKFGTTVWTYQWDPPYDDALRRIAGLGFTAVELIAWDRETLETYYTDERIRHLRNLMADLGLELSEFVSTPPGMASPDPTIREQAVDHFKRLVEVALDLGTTLVNGVSPNPFDLAMPRIMQKHLAQEWSMDFPPNLDWQQNWADYVEVTRRCCAICEDAGVRYALEPHPYRWMRNAASMARLLEHVNSPALGMNFDPSHLFPMGELSEMVVYEIGDRIFHTHFSDNDGTSNAHWRPGKGKINWRAVLRTLKEVGYDNVISIELEDVPGVAHRGVASTPALDSEVTLARDYLSALCAEVGIQVQTSE
jgi:sugar phosphate isomerase/epimerase